MTKLVFLHGAPSVGKLTVAKALMAQVGGRLLDNHTSIDFARAMFDFNTAGFWDLALEAGLLAVQSAVEHDVPLVIKTFCYAHPEDIQSFEKYENIVVSGGGEALPVFLYCSEEESARRVVSPERKERKKLSNPESLAKFKSGYSFQPVPRDNVLCLNTEELLADESAREIVRHFNL